MQFSQINFCSYNIIALSYRFFRHNRDEFDSSCICEWWVSLSFFKSINLLYRPTCYSVTLDIYSIPHLMNLLCRIASLSNAVCLLLDLVLPLPNPKLLSWVSLSVQFTKIHLWSTNMSSFCDFRLVSDFSLFVRPEWKKLVSSTSTHGIL